MRRTIRTLVLAAAAVAVALAVAPASPGARAESPAGERDVAGRIVRFREDRDSVERTFGVPFSAAGIDREEAVVRQLAEEIESSEWRGGVWGGPRDREQTEQVDWHLLAGLARRQRADLAFDRTRLARSLALAPFAADLAALEASRRLLEPLAPRAAAERLDAARKAIDEARARIEKDLATPATAPSPAAAHRTAQQIDALRGALRGWFDDRNGFEPEFAWWVRKPFDASDAALDGFAKFLREKVVKATDDGGGPIVGDPIGAAALRAALDAEWVPYTPQEILGIADREFAWCEAEARRASREMGLGDDWKKALAKVKESHVEPGRQDELVAAQARDAIEFVTSRNLVTVPELCRATWSLRMIPEHVQRTMPYAYYSGDSMGVAYPTSDMDHGRKLQSMRGNNEHFSRIVTPHELIPGHHLQLFHAARERPYRGAFRTPFLVEGWALYWEMRLWDLGWARSPEDRIGMLFWRMHRCARITVTMKFHLGEVTPPQMIDFLVDRVGHEKDGATAEVRRYVSGGYGPLYQAAYMLGGLQLRALHRETVGAGKMSEREFHDGVLRQGSIPVRLIRVALTGETISEKPLEPWRFAE